jgi:hypothetical protein
MLTQDRGKGMRKYSGVGLHWLKHNVCKDIIPRQKSHWSTDRHLNNEEEE